MPYRSKARSRERRKELYEMKCEEDPDFHKKRAALQKEWRKKNPARQKEINTKAAEKRREKLKRKKRLKK